MHRGARILATLAAVVSLATAFGSTTFAATPQYITRAQYVHDLDIALGVAPVFPATPTFSDVPKSNPYYGYIEAAYQKGFIAGYSATVFGVDGLLTREQVAKIEVTALGDANEALQQMSSSSVFTDDAQISAYARGFVVEASQLGLVHGYPDGSFRPQAFVTTSDESAFIHQLVVATGSSATPSKPTVIATIPVGTNPVGVATDPTTNRVYVTNLASDTVSVIDGTTDKVVATIFVGYQPRGIGVDAQTNTVYVTDVSTADGSNKVSVINGADDTVTGSITIPSRGYGLGVDSLTDTVYVASDHGTFVIDGATATLTATVAATGETMAVDQTTDTIYVGGGLSTRLSAINEATDTSSTVIPGSVNAVAVDSSTNHLYAATGGGGATNIVEILDGTSFADLLEVEAAAYRIAVDDTTHTVYWTNGGRPGTVTVFDGSTWLVTATVAVGNTPEAIAVNSATHRVYVVNFDSNTVSVIGG